MEKEDVLSLFMVCEPLENIKSPSGKNDLTHFKDSGARFVTRLIADAVPECVPELAKYLKSKEIFTDISGHWVETDINYARDMGIVNGRGKGKFAPDDDITRAEFLKMAMDAAGISAHGYRRKPSRS